MGEVKMLVPYQILLIFMPTSPINIKQINHTMALLRTGGRFDST